MRHLLTAIACFFALSMSAQESLPWNPNANNDNIIGTVDLLAMLNVYGEEYSVQTCSHGAGYDCSALYTYQGNGQANNNIYYLPSDAGFVEALRYGNNVHNRFLRFSTEALEGKVVILKTNHQTGEGHVICQYQDYDGNWTTFYDLNTYTMETYPVSYDKLVKTSDAWVRLSYALEEIQGVQN